MRLLFAVCFLILFAAPAAFAQVMPPTGSANPEGAVDARLEAYNAHDLDAFLATLDPEVIILQFPDREISRGVDQMRLTYGRLFENRVVQAEVEGRMVQGPFVIDQEKVEGLHGGTREHTVIYYVNTEGLIQRIWYMTQGQSRHQHRHED